MTSLNGASIVRRRDTIFIALPAPLQIPIEGGCDCPYCKAHPDRIPAWDTLAVPAKPGVKPDTAWTVHNPEFK